MKIASISFGKDSLAMVLRLMQENKELDEVVFYDTGMEFQAIYNVRNKIVPLIESYGAKYIEMKPKEPFLYTMLKRKVISKQKGLHYGYGWCGGVCRWGTTEKLKVLNKYAKENDATIYVGIAADEKKRAQNKEPYKEFPLIEWGMTERDCLEYCRSFGIKWEENGIDLYDVLDRVSCWCCCNKNLKELRNIYNMLPDYWEKLKGLQEKLERPMKKSGSVFELEERFSNGK